MTKSDLYDIKGGTIEIFLHNELGVERIVLWQNDLAREYPDTPIEMR